MLGVVLLVSQSDPTATQAQQRGGANAPSSIPMGGNKSVTRFFVTSNWQTSL
jgi:hypothetical protein